MSVEVISTAPLVPLTISTDPTGHASSFVFSLDTEIHSESTPAGTSPQLPGIALNVGTIHPGVATPLSSVPFQPESSPLRSSVPPPVFNSLRGVPASLSSIPHIPESSLLGGSFLSSPSFSIISSQSSLGVPLDTTAHHSPPKSPVLSSTSTTLPGSHTTSHSQLTADSFSIILGNPRISRPTETIVLPTSSSPVPISIGVTVSTSSNHRSSISTGSIASGISHLRSSSSTSKFQTSPTTQSLIAIPISSSTSAKTSTDNQVPGISTSISSSAVRNVTSTSPSMSPTSQITSLESKDSSSDAAPSSGSSIESAPHETPQSEVQTKSADSSSESASIQTIISTVTAPGVSPSPVTLVTTVEASPSQGDSGEITPTQPPKTESHQRHILQRPLNRFQHRTSGTPSSADKPTISPLPVNPLQPSSSPTAKKHNYPTIASKSVIPRSPRKNSPRGPPSTASQSTNKKETRLHPRITTMTTAAAEPSSAAFSAVSSAAPQKLHPG